MPVIDITAGLVTDLVREQFPQWGDLPVRAVEHQGWDNRTFRLGDEMTVRLPSAAGYVPAVEKENRCLPVMAAHLPVPVPVSIAVGRPGSGYPFPWSVRNWLPGDTVMHATDVDRVALARDLGAFIVALRDVPTERGPAAGRHSYYRGCHPSAYGDQVQSALAQFGGADGGPGIDGFDVAACEAVWASALRSVWKGEPTWFHGDLASGNLLTSDGKLTAVIDFGTCGVGDPACDLVVAWVYFIGEERQIFREAVGLDDDTWRRARGWALWKSLITMAGASRIDPDAFHSRVLAEILRDPVIDQ